MMVRDLTLEELRRMIQERKRVIGRCRSDIRKYEDDIRSFEKMISDRIRERKKLRPQT